MEQVANHQPDENNREMQIFVWVRIAGAVVLAIALMWGVVKLIDIIHPSHPQTAVEPAEQANPSIPDQSTGNLEHEAVLHEESAPIPEPAVEVTHDEAAVKAETPVEKRVVEEAAAYTGPPGVLFVDALMAPLQYELKQRFWGWRPNDLIEFTDNVNEYQLGVLEVTRRTTTRLTENISRTGSTAAINKHLERAMNSLMIRADRYLFPSAENQYEEALGNLERYKKQLISGEASFYTRADNLLPLLESLEELLGSCDENLVKRHEDTGSTVSTFQADNYFYYAKGVAGAMLPILVAVEQEYNKVLITRNAAEVMHHAVESCRVSSELEPWLFVTEANLNGIFANHRANMAAHISHARFFLGLLVKSLST